jgi:hypothetical protein
LVSSPGAAALPPHVFQMDPALGYGLGEFGRMMEALERGGYSRAQPDLAAHIRTLLAA